jgi:hypothetical protein
MGKSGDRLLREGSQGSREDRRVASVVAGDAASEVGDGKRRAWVPPDRASTRARSLVIQSSKRYNGAPVQRTSLNVLGLPGLPAGPAAVAPGSQLVDNLGPLVLRVAGRDAAAERSISKGRSAGGLRM